MKRVLLILLVLASKISYGQLDTQLRGTWIFQYALQSNYDSCNLSKENGILIFNIDNTYSWEVNGSVIKGNWKIETGKLKLYNSKGANFEGTILDIMYPIEINNGFLIIHNQTLLDNPCPHLYYKKEK